MRAITLFVIVMLLFTGCKAATSEDPSNRAVTEVPDAMEGSPTPGTPIAAEFKQLELDLDYTNLRWGEPDPSLDEIFVLEDALFRMDQIAGALESFMDLTEQVKGKVSKEDLERIGNTSWEVQVLGFHNWGEAVLGTLMKQELLIKKLEFEMAIRQAAAGEIDQEQLERKESEFAAAKENFQLYLDSYTIRD